MDKRSRSPNYPAFGLPTAIEKVTALYRNQHTHGAPREVAVKSMGYSGVNGASATAISAVMKYGLLDRSGDEVKISSRAMCILHPQSPEEKSEAIRAAAMEPPLFRELAEKFPGKLPTDDVLKNYLIRNGFSPAAVSQVISAYKETSEFADREVGGYDSGSIQTIEVDMQPQTIMTPSRQHAPNAMINNEDDVTLARWDYPDGEYIRIICSKGLDVLKAMSMAEKLIKWQREELEDRKASVVSKLKGEVFDVADTDNA